MKPLVIIIDAHEGVRNTYAVLGNTLAKADCIPFSTPEKAEKYLNDSSLVITDSSGIEFAEESRKKGYSGGLIFATGGSDHSKHYLKAKGYDECWQKPFKFGTASMGTIFKCLVQKYTSKTPRIIYFDTMQTDITDSLSEKQRIIIPAKTSKDAFENWPSVHAYIITVNCPKEESDIYPIVTAVNNQYGADLPGIVATNSRGYPIGPIKPLEPNHLEQMLKILDHRLPQHLKQDNAA